MKRFLCVWLACMMLAVPGWAEETAAGSWSQINRAVSKTEDW